MTKYSIIFFVAGILAGLAVTRERRFFSGGLFWGGTGLAVLIFLPNLIWLARHDFISYHFLQHIHARDVGEGRASGFLPDQFLVCANLVAAPLWIWGLIDFLRSRRYRLLGLMYVFPLALFLLAKGRGYYLAGAYPMLIAMGAGASERWIETLSRPARRTVEIAFFAALATCGVYIAAIVLPLASSGPLKKFALSHNGDLREEIGWNDLVKTVASIRDSLAEEQREHLGIVVGNYGEQGAIEMLGAAYHLPTPISGTNSAWLRGYPVQPPSILIVVGVSRAYAEKTFTGCSIAGHNGNSEGINNEESQYHPDIFVCGSPRQPWPEFWRDFQAYG